MERLEIEIETSTKNRNEERLEELWIQIRTRQEILRRIQNDFYRDSVLDYRAIHSQEQQPKQLPWLEREVPYTNIPPPKPTDAYTKRHHRLESTQYNHRHTPRS